MRAMIASHLDAPEPGVRRRRLQCLLYAGLVTGVTDGLFASVLSVFFHSTPTRVFQGVASTVMGPRALEGGTATAAIGIAMHFGVAFGWSTVFLLLDMRSSRVRTLVRSRYGALKAATLFGPAVWMTMSFAVIPLLVRRPPTITIRWWIQLAGHIPFVALPMITMIRQGAPRSPVAEPQRL